LANATGGIRCATPALRVLADARAGKPLPRAMVLSIQLDSPKITRKLTTAWFATRVDDPTSAACGSNRAAAAEIRIS